MTPPRVDVVVSGGGPAGAVTALVLARRRRSVLVVEPGRDRRLLGESLPPAARPLLADLGIVLGAGHLASHGTLSAWGSGALVPRDHVFDPHGHALQLDRRRFGAELRAAARAAGAELLDGVRVDEVTPHAGGFEVRIAGRAIAARWLVDATGRRAAIGRELGASRVRDDALTAFVGELRPARDGDRDSRLVIEAAADGWWYCALTPGGTRVVAFLTDRDLVDPRPWISVAGFEAQLAATTHLAPRLAVHGHALAGRPRAVSATGGQLSPWRGPGWLAVGDAALAFDPLSSQGIFHALYTGLHAGHAIADALDGDLAALDAYDHRLTEIRAAYLRNHAAYYAAEPRWADRPFWRRRARGAS